MDVMWAIAVVDHLQRIESLKFFIFCIQQSSNYLDNMTLEGLFEIVGHLSSWDCTIKTVDWMVNCESLDASFGEASQHNCPGSFE